MHHFYTETGSFKKIAVIGGFNEQARASYKTHLQTYVKDVIRRPLGKLLVSAAFRSDPQEFFEGIEVLLQSSAPQEVGYHISYNKVALRKVMALFPPEEVGIAWARLTCR